MASVNKKNKARNSNCIKPFKNKIKRVGYYTASDRHANKQFKED